MDEMSEMTVGEKIHVARVVIKMTNMMEFGPVSAYDLFTEIGIGEGFRGEKICIENETVRCVFCGEVIDTDKDGDILMAIADPDNDEECEFAENTHVVMFAGMAHESCREGANDAEVDSRRYLFDLGRKEWKKEQDEAFDGIKEIFDRVIAKEKEMMKA